MLLQGDDPWGPVRTNTWPQSQVVLAAALLPLARQDGHQLTLLDLRTLPDPSNWRQAVNEPHLDPIEYGDLELTRLLIGDYRARIKETPADVFVLTANFTVEANSVFAVMKALKTAWPKALIVVGGRDASALERRERYFKEGADFIGVGDGDLALPRFISRLHSVGARGIAAEYQDRIISGGISKQFRSPPHDLRLKGLDLSRYQESGGGPLALGAVRDGFAAYVETSRGCPRECSFCTEARTELWKQGPGEIIQHLDAYIDAGAELLMVSDDNLLATNKPEHLIEIFRHLRDRGVSWEFPVGLEVGLLTKTRGGMKDALIDALFWNQQSAGRFVGAHRLLFPLEDALLHDTGLSKLKRVRGRTSEIATAILERGIPFMNIAIMIGGPNETSDDRAQLETRLETLSALVGEHNTRVNFSVFCTSALPGTPFGREVTQAGLLSHSIDEAPELWSVFVSAINGCTHTAVDTTQYRRDLLRRHNMLQCDGKVAPPARP